jgi:hypothetical protein
MHTRRMSAFKWGPLGASNNRTLRVDWMKMEHSALSNSLCSLMDDLACVSAADVMGHSEVRQLPTIHQIHFNVCHQKNLSVFPECTLTLHTHSMILTRSKFKLFNLRILELTMRLLCSKGFCGI